jgi:Bacillus/Clostridium GerA spore germination protein.
MSRSAETRVMRWTAEDLRRLFSGSGDIVFLPSLFDDREESRVLMVYQEGLCDSNRISQSVLPELRHYFARTGSFARAIPELSGILPVKPIEEAPSEDSMAEAVYDGNLLILFEAEGTVCKLDYSDRPQRTPFESSTEISIKGPKDCFIEDISVNIALIRKRIRSRSLHVEKFVLGRRTKTKVGLVYFSDILNKSILEDVRKKLNEIDIDGLYSIGQLEEQLVGSPFKIMPLLDFTGRPDYAVSSLLAGRFILIIDGNPMVLIGPAGLSYILKSPEDVHFNYSYVSFARIIRIVSFFLSIFLPAIWVALMAFHQDQIPFRMMATVSVSRLGLPLSAQMEMFILLMLLEVFREAGVRLPTAIGQTLTSIGGLIIGDAAIRAGLVSPSVVVIGAITAVCGVTLVNQTLSTVVSILRLFFFTLASFLGIYGVILGMVLWTGYLSSLNSFGVNYLTPLSPLRIKDILQSYLRLPWVWSKQRPGSLKPIDGDHQGEGEG